MLQWLGSAGLTIGVDDLSELWSVLWQKPQKSSAGVNSLWIAVEYWRGKWSSGSLKNSCTELKIPRCSMVMRGPTGWLRNFETESTKNSSRTGLPSNYISLSGRKSIQSGLIYTCQSQHILNFPQHILKFPWTSPSDVFIFTSTLSVRGKYFSPLKPKHPRWDLAECQNSGGSHCSWQQDQSAV